VGVDQREGQKSAIIRGKPETDRTKKRKKHAGRGPQERKSWDKKSDEEGGFIKAKRGARRVSE